MSKFSVNTGLIADNIRGVVGGNSHPPCMFCQACSMDGVHIPSNNHATVGIPTCMILLGPFHHQGEGVCSYLVLKTWLIAEHVS